MTFHLDKTRRKFRNSDRVDPRLATREKEKELALLDVFLALLKPINRIESFAPFELQVEPESLVRIHMNGLENCLSQTLLFRTIIMTTNQYTSYGATQPFLWLPIPSSM